MSCIVTIKSHPQDDQNLFYKEFDSRVAFDDFSRCCVDAEAVDVVGSALAVVRTDTVKNFCTDFLLPTFIHVTRKVHSWALKILCLAVDLCTFPVRLVTLLPRVIHNLNHAKEKHPLYQYLLQQGVDVGRLEYVYVVREWTEPGHPPEDLDTRITYGRTIKFLDLPKASLDESACKTEWSTYGSNVRVRPEAAQ